MVRRTTVAQVAPQAARRFVVTGTGGLGFETALALAGAGGELILAGRNPDKGAEAVRRIKDETPAASLRFERLDLADLGSVASFAERLLARGEPIDGLVNNAGIWSLPTLTRTVDGFEAQFGINHLGHFALTARLLPLLRLAPAPRVISVTSSAHRVGGIDFDNLQGERRYHPALAYCQSKLAQAAFALELQRRSDQAGWGLKSLAAHPGFASTEIFANGTGAGSFTAIVCRNVIAPLLGHSPAAGARAILHAATSPEAEGGMLYGPRGFLEMRGEPGPCAFSPVAEDAKVAAQLWQVSEQLTGLSMAEPAPAGRH